MSAKPILIAQISDLHIKAPGALAYGRVDTAKALTRCVAALNEFRPRPDLVVISGDLADTPTAEEYDHLKRLLAPLELPWMGIPGNHDSRELMRGIFRRALCGAVGSAQTDAQRCRIGGHPARLQRDRKAARRIGGADAAMARNQ
jgi:Icc protein